MKSHNRNDIDSEVGEKSTSCLLYTHSIANNGSCTGDCSSDEARKPDNREHVQEGNLHPITLQNGRTISSREKPCITRHNSV